MAKKIITHGQSIEEESAKGARLYVGVDVHKSKYAVSILSENGAWHSFVAPADNQGLIRMFTERGLKITALAYEAGLTGFGLCRVSQAAGIETLVVAACRMPRPVTRSAKTDRVDSLKLAEYLAGNLLRPIAVPTEEREARRAQVRWRNQLSTDLVKVKVRIKSFLTLHGLPEPGGLAHWSGAAVSALEKMELSGRLRSLLDSHLRQLKFFREELRAAEEEIKERVLPPAKEDVLQSVPGVGPLTSAVFRTEIFSPERFERSEEVGSFVGLSPVIKQSGEDKGSSRLSPCGQGKLRQMLVEAAWILMRKEKWAQELYKRLLRRGRASQQAIVAVARKLAVILWKLLLENRLYRSSGGCPATAAK